MRRQTLFAALLMLAMTCLSSAATILTATDQGGTTGLYATIKIESVAGDMLKLTTTLVPDPTSNGDITGVFFDFEDGLPGGFSLTDDIDGTDITDREKNTNNMTGGGPNLTPIPAFQVALAIGSQGGNDIFTSTVIYILNASSYNLSEASISRVGVRVQSVEPSLNGKSSLKLVTQTSTEPDVETSVPEPSTMLLFGAGLGLLGLARLRRR